MKKKFIISALFTLLLLSLIGCGKKQTEEVKTYTEIADSSDYFDDYEEKYISLFTFYKDKLFCYNKFNEKLEIYDSNKKLLHQFSQKGKGPSEIIFPYSLICDKDGLFVLDMQNVKVLWFSEDGKHIDDIKLNQSGRTIAKVGKELIVSTNGLYNYYLDKTKLEKPYEFKGMIKSGNKQDPKKMDIKKMLSNRFNVIANSKNIFLYNDYKDSLITYTLDGKLISRQSENLPKPPEPKINQSKTQISIFAERIMLKAAKDEAGNIYILATNYKTKEYIIIKHSPEGKREAIYNLPHKIYNLAVIEDGKFLVSVEDAKLMIFNYKK